MSKKILIAEDDQDLLEMLKLTIEDAGFEVDVCDNGYSALSKAQENAYSLLLSDIQMPNMNGVTLAGILRQKVPGLPIVLMTANSDIEMAVSAMQQGARDFIPKPFSIEKLIGCIKKHTTQTSQEGLVVADPKSVKLLQVAEKVALTPASVLITGPSGTGKEVMAKYIHEKSPRNSKPFVAINCAAIPQELLESILFGHKKGAFTGAAQNQMGKFSQACGGTLFLDEIGDMPAQLQSKLLRALQERQIEPIGSAEPVPIDVRLIAATHRDLKKEILEGRFREDLFYRLNVFPMEIPALKDRPQDIIPLARFLLTRHAKNYQRSTPTISHSGQKALVEHDWPGNIRELENVVQRALILGGDILEKEDFSL